MAEASKSSVIPFELESESQKDKIKEITDKLEAGIKDLFNSEKYMEYLQTMSKFHNYSFNNTLLIMFQKPDASAIAGYDAWKKKFHRQVKEGEKGIKIIAPAPYKKTVEVEKLDKAGQPVFDGDGKPVMTTKEIKIPTFKVASVFDVSQTDGEPLPTIATQLEGNIEAYEKFFRTLKEISPVPITLEPIDSSANGFFSPVEKRIVIKDSLSEMQTIKTAIHEIAHSMLHALPEKGEDGVTVDDRPDSRTKEVQAESIAYTVCQRFGIETSDYSFGYIAGWSSGQETKELKASLEIIRETASDIIEKIEEKMPELSQERKAVKQADKPFDYDKTVDYVLRMARKVGLAEENKQGLATFNMAAKRFGKLATTIPENQKELKELCEFVASSENLSSMQERVNEVANYIRSKELSEEKSQDVPDIFKPEVHPVVTVIWSESDKIPEGVKMTLAEADKLFQDVDAFYISDKKIYKTKFQIDYTMNGVPGSYEGTYNLGCNTGGIPDHIYKLYEFCKNSKEDKELRINAGTEVWEEFVAKCDFAMEQLTPYLRLHIALDVMEHSAKEALQNKEMSQEHPYYSAIVDYVHNSRVTVNNTEPSSIILPTAPQKDDFIVKNETKEKKPSVRNKLKQEKEKIAKETPKPKTKTKTKAKTTEAEVS